jgi:hypothetical protein
MAAAKRPPAKPPTNQPPPVGVNECVNDERDGRVTLDDRPPKQPPKPKK